MSKQNNRLQDSLIPKEVYNLSEKLYKVHGNFLEAMYTMDGHTLKEIVDEMSLLHIKPGARYCHMSRIVSDFEKQGFVKRCLKDASKDKKVIIVKLTPLGRTVVDAIAKASYAIKNKKERKESIIVINVEQVRSEYEHI